MRKGYFGRSPLALAVVAAGLVMAPAVANAASFTFTTTSPNQATATLVTSLNTITLTLQNLTNNPHDASDLLTGFGFTTAISGGSLTSGMGLVRDVNGDGTYSDSGVQSIIGAEKWKTETLNPWTYFISDLNAQPDFALIGAPGGPGNNYAAANNSIKGNDPHNPFTAGIATFVFTAQGVTADSLITGATFRFGTVADSGFQDGGCVSGCGRSVDPDVVPEPASMLLLGTGLAGAALRRRRKA